MTIASQSAVRGVQIIGALQQEQQLRAPRGHLGDISNSNHSLALRVDSASPATGPQLPRTGNDVFDSSASRAAASMFTHYPGLEHLIGRPDCEPHLGPWALVLNTIASINSDGELSDEASKASGALSSKLKELSSYLTRHPHADRSTLKAKGLVLEVDKLARKALLALGEGGFAKLARMEIYPALVQKVAVTRGGTIDDAADVVAELDQKAVDGYMQLVDHGLRNDVGLRYALLTFFKIPQLLKVAASPPETPSPTSPAQPPAWPTNMPPGGNYNPVTVSPTFNFDNAAMVKAIGELLDKILTPIFQRLLERLQSAEMSRGDDSKGSDTMSVAEDSYHPPSRRRDSSFDHIGAGKQLGYASSTGEVDEDDDGSGDGAGFPTASRLPSIDPLESRQVTLNSSPVEAGTDAFRSRASSLSESLRSVGSARSSRVISPQNDDVFTDDLRTHRASSGRPSRATSPQGVIQRQSGLDPVQRVKEVEREGGTTFIVESKIHDPYMSTGATSLPARFVDLNVAGTVADASVHRHTPRATQFVEQLAKGRDVPFALNDR